MKERLKLSDIDLIFLAITTLFCIAKLTLFNGYTGIVTDEIQYKEIILGLKEANLFNPLYYIFYTIIKYAGDSWYIGTRFINLLWIYIALEAIRRICLLYNVKRWKKIVVYTSAMCNGVSFYMLNAMPECMYIAGVYWTVYVLLEAQNITLKNTLKISCLAGCIALIKPHAILLYPIFLIAYVIKGEIENKKQVIENIIISGSVFIIVRWGIGWITSGSISLGLFGGAYESLGNKNILATLNTTLYIISRHSLVWAVIAPLTVSWLYIVSKALINKSIKKSERPLHFLAWGMLITGIVVYSMFTSSVNTDENLQYLRIHLRYYSFVTPLLIISALKLEKYIKQIVESRELFIINSIVIVTFLLASLLTSFENNIIGNWIDSPMLIMIKNQETLIIQSILSITVIIGICWRKSLVLAVYYTITLLLVSETKHWSVSHKQMKNTLEASKAYNYLEMATYKSGFNILIKGIVTPEYYNTKREMIDCIKLAMLQTERTFKNLCLKDISKSKEDYLITYSDINYGSMLNMYCHKSELLELSNYKLNLLEKKTLGWKNINAFKNKNEVLSMKGFNKNESWGRWAKNKQTRIYLRKMLNGNSQIKFMARSLNKAAIRIGSMTIELDKEWKQVKYNIKNMNCMEVVEIEYIGKPTTIEGRTLTYAIKKLEIINQNTFN